MEIVRSKRPSVAVARYGAIGSVSLQTQVVLPPVVAFETSTPFAITVRPVGDGDAEVVGRLVARVVVAGYHAGEPCGSLTTKAPSSVGTQPSIDPSGSVTTAGVPA